MDENNLPFILFSGGDHFTREFTITADQPVVFGVMAEGYRRENVEVRENSPHEIKVRLREK